ncbi:ATP-binding cassette domain-containing protein, partial [Pseudocitrobacter sp. 73]|uniref:ATP-binding cassette domain-containing protein n=1 Tax=Pseudocitrobacter sp. 73 TaxID=2605731 RepID=UPI0011F04724
EFIVMVGPSGCEKSTLLRMVAGLERATSGDIWIDGKRVTEMEPKDRGIAMVFQNYALYPHMSVEENMAWGLKIRGMGKQQIAERVKEAARI